MERGAVTGTEAALHTALSIICASVLFADGASLHFTKEPKSQDALHGRSAMLRCEASGMGIVHYRWLYNGWPVNDTDRRFLDGGNLKFTAVDRWLDSGVFQCVAVDVSADGGELRSTNASFNIKWLDTGDVTLKEPATEADIQSSGSVTLRCNIDGHPRPTCLWFKDGSRLSEQTHLIHNKARTLSLPRAQPEDSGLYYCCARNAVGHVCSSSNFSLSIMDKSFPRAVLTPDDQVTLKNEEAFFHCQFSAEPPPSIEWFHGAERLTNRSRVIVYENGTLHITQVKAYSTGVYECVARGSQGPSISLRAQLLLAEIGDASPPMSRVLKANSLERVPCQSPWGQPAPAVWWERDGARVPAHGRVHQEGTELVFSPAQPGDTGLYVCMSQNKAGERRQELQVTVATAPQWVTKPVDTRMEEGHPGYLHCHTHATPDPRVIWHRGTAPITTEETRFQQFPNGTLLISSVEVYDSLTYSCESSNQAGVLMGSARVSVLERLKFTPMPRPSQCLELEKETSIPCLATGRETPSVRWTRADGRQLQPRARQHGGTLHFTKVMREDAGDYVCVASNSLQGQIQAEVHLTVAEFVNFKLVPENMTVYHGHTAILHCQATGDPLPLIQWMVKDKVLEQGSSRFQKLPNGSLVISEVSMEDTGKYTCLAGNSCSIRSQVAQLYVVEKPETRVVDNGEKAPYRMIQTIGLSVGAAVAYIIVVLGLMFYCKKKRNSKRQQKNPDGEETEMECLNGVSVQQNEQSNKEMQSDALPPHVTRSSSDVLSFPRSSLHTITRLGRGQYGEVLLAKAKGIQEGQEETVVLLKSLHTQDEQLQLDFRREGEMFGRLDHENVVRLLGLCREAQPHYMILEYVDLGDLKQFLTISRSKEEKRKLQRFSTKQKVSICTQVAQGMEHLSSHRFVHKDLAARNCLISAGRRVKVSALSLSKDVYNSEYYQYQQAWIPLRWLPAESVFEQNFSTKTDVWSMGVLMWEVFSLGELPYSNLSNLQLLEGLQEGDVKLPVPEGCPSWVYKLMVRCWAPSLKDRPSFSDIITRLSDLSVH